VPTALSPCVRGLLLEFDRVDDKILAACNNADKDSSAELGTANEPNFDRRILDQLILDAAVGPAPSNHKDITTDDDILTKLNFIEDFKEDTSEDQAEQGKAPNFAMGAYLDDYLLHHQSLDSERKRPSTRRALDQEHAPAKKRKSPEADVQQLGP